MKRNLGNSDVLVRPVGKEVNANEVAFLGSISSAQVLTRRTLYTNDYEPISLDMVFDITEENGQQTKYGVSANYSWGKSEPMVKLLKKLKILPKRGQALDLEKAVGLPVKILFKKETVNGTVEKTIQSIKRHTVKFEGR